MEISTDYVYEGAALEFLSEMIKKLDSLLKLHGVKKDNRKSTCEDFFFDRSYSLDHGTVEYEGKTYNPLIGFLAENKEHLHITSEYFAWHDYALGTVAEFYGE